jgi:hypothetical protein
MSLENEDGAPLATAVTTQGGMYVFVDLWPGTYWVREHQPKGYLSTTPDLVTTTVGSSGISVVDFGDKLPVVAQLPLLIKGGLSLP